MTEPSATLRALVDLGFERRPKEYGMETVGFHSRHLDLTASDGVGRYFRPVVLLLGNYNTGRRLGIIDSELPHDLYTVEEAAAWLSYTLRGWKEPLDPLPDWFIEGERNWHLIPMVRRQGAYENRPKCTLRHDQARLFRRELWNAIGALNEATEALVSFDGRVLSVQLADETIEALGKGRSWPSEVLWPLSAETGLPQRFSTGFVLFDYFDGQFGFANHKYPAKEGER